MTLSSAVVSKGAARPGREPWSVVPWLGAGEVHVWRVELDVPLGADGQTEWLAPEERQRASQFRFERDRRRYLAHRRALRSILAAYLAVAPGRVRFCDGEDGKPGVAGEGERGLQFSVSHSGGLAMYVLRRGLPVGVDLERIDPGFAWMEAASLIFSPSELDHLEKLPADQRLERFFAIWTRKEAVAKAAGVGLRAGLASLEVPAGSCCSRWSRCRLLVDRREREFSVIDLTAGPGFRAALAVEGVSAEIKIREVDPHAVGLPGLPV